PGGEHGDRIAQAALAERPEEGEVLAHLRRGRAAAPGQLGGGDGGLALRGDLLEEPEVQGEPPHRALRDLPHIVNYFTIERSNARAARTPPGRASRDARSDRPRAPPGRPPRRRRSAP